MPPGSVWLVCLVELEHGKEGFLRHLHIAYLLHALLAFLLLLEQFSLTAHVSTVTFGGNVLANLLHGLAGNDLGTDGRLDSDIKLLSRNELLEFLAHLATQCHGVALMGKGGQSIHRLTVEQDVELGQLGRTETIDVIVERGISLADGLEFVLEVDDNFAERNHEVQLHTVAADILLLDEFAALVKT